MTVDRERYRAEGILFPQRVFGSDEIAELRAEFDRFDADEGEDRPQERNRGRHLDRPFVWRMATDERILDLMRQLIGPDLVIFGTDFFDAAPEARAAAADVPVVECVDERRYVRASAADVVFVE